MSNPKLEKQIAQLKSDLEADEAAHAETSTLLSNYKESLSTANQTISNLRLVGRCETCGGPFSSDSKSDVIHYHRHCAKPHIKKKIIRKLFRLTVEKIKSKL